MLYVWLGVTVVALVLEFVTSDMISIWFAGGGLVAMILQALGSQYYVQIPAFILVSVILLLCFRKMVMKRLASSETKLNADSVIGKEFILLEDISFNKPGAIKVNDVVWSAIAKDETTSIPKNTVVRVVDLKGNKYIVEGK